ncbi:hypothetical protein ANCCEY_00919 [Ancylostoma ceylanicum]|uniref:PABS domain-containing protein n=1 Tax=Ancylostoma ceylanicum TaxID=53326 RepID=A0A0D6M781_9BILA|nr:hypothetical protein ANCCEY_00919 [Ancylostoma ceylanicum]
MVAGVFFSGALDFNSTEKQDVLIIGLGGGIINNYLTTMPNHTIDVTVVDIDPVMKRIAEKWYDFQPSQHHRLVIDDGIRFVHEAAKRGMKYDAILLDVCYNIRRPMMCPIEEFLKDDVISAMRAITSERGAVIVNIITTKDGAKEADRYYFSSRFSAKEEVKSPEQTMEEILLHSFPSKIVERICSNFTGACFTLVDKMEKKRGRCFSAFAGTTRGKLLTIYGHTSLSSIKNWDFNS